MAQNGNIPGTPKEQLRGLRIIAAALCIGLLFFTLICLVINSFNGGPALQEEHGLFYQISLYIAVALGATGLLIARIRYARKTMLIKNDTGSLDHKLNKYRETQVSVMALCEGPALFSVVVFFLTGQFVVLIVMAVLLLQMILFIPSSGKLATDLGLDWNETEQLK